MKTHAAFKMYFDRKKKSSPGFSMRGLAKRMDVSPSFLSRALSGKKPIPADLRLRLAIALDVEPELVAPSATEKTVKTEEISTVMEDWALAKTAAQQVLRNWYYLPIIEMTTLANCDGTAQNIAQRLKLSVASTEVALRELVSLEILKEENGVFRKTQNKLRITSSTSKQNIRKFHDEMMEKAQIELRTASSEEEFQRRLIAGITISATPEKIQEAKRKIADFMYEIANDLTANPGTEVYHLATQLFPLTKPE